MLSKFPTLSIVLCYTKNLIFFKKEGTYAGDIRKKELTEFDK